ncbi:MAG: carbon storage regulator CsrA [Negativicutes bacterium]
MLVLTRKPGERLFIGDDIVITIVEVKGDNIRIGIEAPREVKVYRGEIFEAIVAENREAALLKDIAGLDELTVAEKKTDL